MYCWRERTVLTHVTGLPAQQDPPPPPSNLTMPNFATMPTNARTYSDAPFYLTVVETYLDCPVRPQALMASVHS